MAAFDIEILDAPVLAAFNQVLRSATDLTPLNREISEALYDLTMQTFEDQGSPAWEPLAAATIADRERDGSWPGMILQRSGGLKASIHPFYSATEAGVAAAKPYAAIQHLGGQAGRGHQVTIPSRPYLPADGDGHLRPDAERVVLRVIARFMAGDIR
jgi:phage virion morphogenesis protein